jgi:hypothetical protein
MPIPMMTRQKMSRPTMEIAGESEESDWARVATMMMISSTPYIFLRPTTSARKPKPSWPRTVPPEVATLMAVSELEGILPFLGPALSCQKTTPSMALARLMAKMS